MKRRGFHSLWRRGEQNARAVLLVHSGKANACCCTEEIGRLPTRRKTVAAAASTALTAGGVVFSGPDQARRTPLEEGQGLHRGGPWRMLSRDGTHPRLPHEKDILRLSVP